MEIRRLSKLGVQVGLDREHQTKGYFTRADFTFDATANAFICPVGKKLGILDF